jgi:hypothetical protein
MGYFVAFSETNAGVAGVEVVTRPRSPALLFLPTAVFAGGILVAGALVAAILNLEWLPLVPYYALAATLTALLVVLVAVFAHVCRLAAVMHPDPWGQLRSRWLRRSLLIRLALPAVAAPLFMTGFVTLKAAATMAIPYNWDVFLTDVDYMIFGVDPWVPLHQVLNRGYIPDFLQFAYLGWQILLPATLASAAIWMKPRNLAVFYSAMFMTWIVAGVVLAALMHSAGPIFAYIFDDELGRRFEPLSGSLMQVFNFSDSRIMRVHTALAMSVGDPVVSRAGGISAMPSVHVAVTIIYVCAAWSRRNWRLAALLVAGIIWVGSVYFGYHYATDGPLAALIAVGCWFASKSLIDYLTRRPSMAAPLVPVLETEVARSR